MTSLQELSETELMSLIARGDALALREAWRRTSALAFGLCLRILKSRTDAEESLQDTFVEVWRRARTFDAGRGSLVAWVLTIARTRSIDRARAAARRHEVTSQETVIPVEGGAGEAALEGLVQKDDRRRVGSALSELPSEQLQVIELAYFQGLTLREVAERTGTPLGTVKTRARAALMKLSGLLAEALRVRA